MLLQERESNKGIAVHMMVPCNKKIHQVPRQDLKSLPDKHCNEAYNANFCHIWADILPFEKNTFLIYNLQLEDAFMLSLMCLDKTHLRDSHHKCIQHLGPPTPVVSPSSELDCYHKVFQ